MPNELNALTVDVNLLEADSTAAVPSTVHWKLLCLETDRTLQDWTAITPTYTTGDDGNVIESSVEIEVSALRHAMQTAGMAVERKALIVAMDMGLSTESSEEIVYEVVRLNARS